MIFPQSQVNIMQGRHASICVHIKGTITNLYAYVPYVMVICQTIITIYHNLTGTQ